MSSNQQHAAVISTTQAGHINPMFEFCRRLAPHDFVVSFVANEQHHSRLEKQLQDEHIRLVLFPEAILHTQEAEPSDLEELLRKLDPPVTCVISDNFLPWSQDLANRLGVPRIGFGTTNALTEVVMLYIPLLRSQGFLPVKGDIKDDRLVTSVPGLPHVHRTQLPFAFYEEEPHTSSLGRAYLRLPEALCLLEHTVEELEPEPVAAWKAASFKYLPIGPLIPVKDEGAPSQADSSCLKWLDEQQASSVLYIAFGSQVSLPMEQVDRIARGVLASGQPFLWAMRRNFVSGSTPDDYETLKAKLSEAGLVLEWAPQSRILQHRSVGGFLTHCGWNSTLEAVSCGVPTLCWPCDVDQNMNSLNMIDKWKIGLQLSQGLDGNTTEEDTEQMIRALMQSDQGEQLRTNARELKNVTTNAWRDAGSSSKNFREFLTLVQQFKHCSLET